MMIRIYPGNYKTRETVKLLIEIYEKSFHFMLIVFYIEIFLIVCVNVFLSG